MWGSIREISAELWLKSQHRDEIFKCVGGKSRIDTPCKGEGVNPVGILSHGSKSQEKITLGCTVMCGWDCFRQGCMK